MKAFVVWLLSCCLIQAEDVSLLIYKIRMAAEQFQQVNQGASREQLFRRCQELTEKKVATLTDVGYMRGKVGENCSCQSNMELLYPCEPDTTSLPDTNETLLNGGGFVPGLWRGFNYTPTAFEPSPVGKITEMQVTRVSKDLVSVQIEIENVEYLRDDVSLRHKNYTGNLIEIKYPRLYRNAFSRVFFIQPGMPLLISAANAMKADGARDPLHYDVVFVVPTLQP